MTTVKRLQLNDLLIDWWNDFQTSDIQDFYERCFVQTSKLDIVFPHFDLIHDNLRDNMTKTQFNKFFLDYYELHLKLENLIKRGFATFKELVEVHYRAKVDADIYTLDGSKWTYSNGIYHLQK